MSQDRDILSSNVFHSPRFLVTGEIYWGSFTERVSISERPDWTHPLRFIGWHLGKRAFKETIHLVQHFQHSPIDEYPNGHFNDSFIDPVDVSVYGSANAIPASSWPTEEQVSSEEVIRGLAMLQELHAERDKLLDL